MAIPKLRVRKDIRDLNDTELDQLVRAFQKIITLPPDHDNSFFKIAGYHGFPGTGYCHHEDPLFPTWHRAYLYRLEEALCQESGTYNLAMPFWDEVSDATQSEGLPSIFTSKMYTFSDTKETILNPLFSYKLQKDVCGDQNPDSHNYNKHAGYETVRYPYSGLVGTQKDCNETDEHNKKVNSLQSDKIVELLNQNIKVWLGPEDPDHIVAAKTKEKFMASLKAPNYTVFSNTESASKWNDEHKDQPERIVTSLEAPHNSIHLAVGGFEYPGGEKPINHNHYPGANGDMGENETAAFDPVFFFHHCFIDCMFWKWQVVKDFTETLEIDPKYLTPRDIDTKTLVTPLTPFQWEIQGVKKEINSLVSFNKSTRQLKTNTCRTLFISKGS